MRDLQQEIYEIIRDSKGSLWDTAGKILHLNHPYVPEICNDCDEMLYLHQGNGGHTRCKICGELEHE